jgi:asparagine synthase (glutamine-hydrolysing)
MCSIFAAVSKNNKRLDHNICVDSLKTTKSRGPDNTYYTYTGNVFVGVNVLSLTGTTTVNDYTNDRCIFSFNGEIYNYNKLYKSDTEELFTKLNATSNKCEVTRNIQGMFCYVFFDKTTHELYLARDVFGEKTIYIYEDENLIIASSTLHGIERYIGKLRIKRNLIDAYFHTRHFLTYNDTVYENVRQIAPGTIETYNIMTHKKVIQTYECITDYIDKQQIRLYDHAKESDLVEELDNILNKVIKQMISQHHQGVSFSGGIDSSLIAYYVAQHTDNYTLIGTNCIGKDYISNDLEKFQQYFNNKIITLDITEQQWCQAIHDAYNITLQPLGSHNYCTKLFLSKFLQKSGVKILFGGEGADELFGGYDFYCKIDKDLRHNTSPYSSKLKVNIEEAKYIEPFVQEHLDRVWDQAYSCYEDTVQATSLADTVLVVSDDGVRNSDQISGWFSVEGRSPFLHKDVLKFALNLPSKYKRGKPLLKQLFKRKFPNINIQKKQGFAGFPNETLKYNTHQNILKANNVDDIIKYDAATLWKLLNIHYFYESYNNRDISRASRKQKW